MHSQDYNTITFATLPTDRFDRLIATLERIEEKEISNNPEWLSLEEAAIHAKMSKATILKNRDAIGCRKVNEKDLGFLKADLDKWLLSYYQKPRTGKSLTVQSRRTG